MPHLDPDQLIIHRTEYARFSAFEKELTELKARLDHENLIVREAFNYRGGDVILKTKDGLMAPHRLKVGSEVPRVITLPCLSALPRAVFVAGEEMADASPRSEVRTYHRVGSLGVSRMPLYEER